jgi:hypothetical protein
MLLSTAYLPPVSFFSKIAATDVFLLEKHEHFVKQTCRNRCYIYGANGIQTLSIPLINTHEKIAVSEKRIAYGDSWQKLHWRSICSAYGNAPFFIYYKDELAPFYEQKFDLLFDYNTALLNTLLSMLGLSKEIRFTVEYEKNVKDDFRDLDQAVPPLKKYHQVFSDKNGFIPNLSIIDLLFNTGPEAKDFLIGV